MSRSKARPAQATATITAGNEVLIQNCPSVKADLASGSEMTMTHERIAAPE